ncbi:MAG TPA: hypothetical protein VF553_04895 [Pyrinomonadaceae bacterium]|jgi:HEAT repeat protein
MKNSKAFAVVKPVAQLLLLLCLSASLMAQAQSDPDEGDARDTSRASARVAERLASRDPHERQRAAEEMARMGATEQQRLVAGYRLQEKDARVRLALDWALYRMGKTETLFAIIRELDTSRRNQAAYYLAQLEGPEPLYIFLERVSDNAKIHLLEALARIGDEKTIERIKDYTSSYDPRIANAAQFAIREITRRQSQPAQPTRPRQTGNTEETEQENQTVP